MGNCSFLKCLQNNLKGSRDVYLPLQKHSQDSWQCPLIVLPKMTRKVTGEVPDIFEDEVSYKNKAIGEVPDDLIPQTSPKTIDSHWNGEVPVKCSLLDSTEVTLKKVPQQTLAKIRHGLEQMDPRWPAQLPHLVAMDCLVRAQSFVDSVLETPEPGMLGYLVRSFYCLMERQLDWYGHHLGLQSEQFNIARTLVENYLTGHVSPNFRSQESGSYPRDVELCWFLLESQVPPMLPDEYQRIILNAGVTYLKMVGMEQFPEWKWWCVDRWAREVLKAEGGYPSPGDVIFTTLQCLLLAGGLGGLREEFAFVSVFSHPYRCHNGQLLFFWNMLRVSMEVVGSLAGYVGDLTAPQLRTTLNSTYFQTCANHARQIFLTDRLLAEFRQVLDIRLLRPKKWRWLLSKRQKKTSQPN